MKNFILTPLITVLLIVGIYLIAYAASTPGDQWVASFIGGGCLGLGVPLLRDF